MAKYVNGDGIKLDYSGMAYIPSHDVVATAKFLAEQIYNLPAADVAPVVRGKWIVRKIGYANTAAFCSACGDMASTNAQTWHEQGENITEYIPILTKFCPNCGAKMDLEEEA